jgi:hypothetical protein
METAAVNITCIVVHFLEHDILHSKYFIKQGLLLHALELDYVHTWVHT